MLRRAFGTAIAAFLLSFGTVQAQTKDVVILAAASL